MLMVSEEKLRRLLKEILHGDATHRQWLLDQIERIIEECKKC